MRQFAFCLTVNMEKACCRRRPWCCECVCWALTVTIGGMGPGCAVLVGIVVCYILLYIIGGIMGPSLLMLFNGITP